MGSGTAGINCTLLQTSDKKLLLFFRKANCNGGGLPSPPSNQSSDDEVSISYPKAELWHHCLLRGANLGSFVSIVFGTPVLLYKGVRQPIALLKRLAGISTYGVVSMYLLSHATYRVKLSNVCPPFVIRDLECCWLQP